MSDISKALVDELLAELGRMIVSFNGATINLRILIETVLGSKKPIHFLLEHMSEGSMNTALLALGSNMDPGPARDHVQHASHFFDIMRVWRNHYVHHTTPSFGVDEDTKTAVVFTYSLKAKKNIVVRKGEITAVELREASTRCRELSDYLHQITVCLDYQEGGKRHHPLAAPVPWPQKPLVPDTQESSLQCRP